MMRSGACVIRREGKRAGVWSGEFRDASGQQVWERLGAEPRWNRQRAERELEKRLDRWKFAWSGPY
jgi:hypothetical protein